MSWWKNFWEGKTPVNPAPYRAVKSRTVTAEGEHVILECDHKLVIHHHRKDAFQCEQCLRDAQKDYEGNL